MTLINLKRPVFHILLILLLGFLAYSNTLSVPFQFDDKFIIEKNPIIKNLQFFSDPSQAQDAKGHFGYNVLKRRYIGYLSFALNYKLHGLDVRGYHIVNILIHLSTAVFLYLFVMLTF